MSQPDGPRQEHHRRSIRLSGFDYTTHGAYFVTIVAGDRRELFGRIINDEMQLNEFGRIVAAEWRRSASVRSNLELGEFVVMPNHLHGIVLLSQDDEGTLWSAPTSGFGSTLPGSLAVIVRDFKGAVTRRLRERGAVGTVWQRNYHERVIRNERELGAIRRYIIDNPQQWALDREHPQSRV